MHTTLARLLTVIAVVVVVSVAGCGAPPSRSSRPSPRVAAREVRQVLDGLESAGGAEAASLDRTYDTLMRYRSHVKDPVLARRVDLRIAEIRSGRMDPGIREAIREARQSTLRRFRTRRIRVGEEVHPPAEILRAMESEGDPELRREAWLALAPFWREIAPPMQRLFELRDEGARSAGWSGEHERKAELEEIPGDMMEGIVARLSEDTEEFFPSIEGGGRIGPWDLRTEDPSYRYPFREPLSSEEVLAAAGERLRSLGFTPGEVAAALDEEEIGPVTYENLQGIRELLVRLGRSLYERGVTAEPPEFRRPASKALVSGVGLFLADVASDPRWLRGRFPGLHGADREPIRETPRERLVRLRFLLVRAEFEREVYHNPTRDFDELWWNLLEKWIGVERFESVPSWASDPELARVSFRYRDDLLGLLAASQIRNYLVRAYGRILDEPRTAEFLREQIFAPGASLAWYRVLEEATVEPLNPRYYLRDILESGPSFSAETRENVESRESSDSPRPRRARPRGSF